MDDDDHIQWPDWLPDDWYLHRNLINSPHTQLYYSNPRGKRFHSKEEVVQYLVMKKVTKQRKRRKVKDPHDMKAEEMKSEAQKELQFPVNPPQECWPDWLPQDWCIERCLENPNNVYYRSPKYKKFRSKDEVLHYLHTHSRKMSKKSRKKKISQSKESR